jgi:hypothetical protein
LRLRLVVVGLLALARNTSAQEDKASSDLGQIFRETKSCFYVEEFDKYVTLIHGSTAEVAILLDENVATAAQDLQNKPYQEKQWTQRINSDATWRKRVQALRLDAQKAQFCVEAREPTQKIEFSKGAFRMALGSPLQEDRLTATVVLGNYQSPGESLSFGDWRRVETWTDEAGERVSGIVFRDMPEPVRKALEDGNISWRWTWRGVPRPAAASYVDLGPGGFARVKTTVLVPHQPHIVFIDKSDEPVWVAP